MPWTDALLLVTICTPKQQEAMAGCASTSRATVVHSSYKSQVWYLELYEIFICISFQSWLNQMIWNTRIYRKPTICNFSRRDQGRNCPWSSSKTIVHERKFLWRECRSCSSQRHQRHTQEDFFFVNTWNQQVCKITTIRFFLIRHFKHTALLLPKHM